MLQVTFKDLLPREDLLILAKRLEAQLRARDAVGPKHGCFNITIARIRDDDGALAAFQVTIESLRGRRSERQASSVHTNPRHAMRQCAQLLAREAKLPAENDWRRIEMLGLRIALIGALKT